MLGKLWLTRCWVEWTSVDNFNVMSKCISRATNRLIVGTPLCRNQDYLNQCIEFTTKAAHSGAIIDMFPAILKPIVARTLVRRTIVRRHKALDRIIAVTGPIFEERQRKLRDLGDAWVDRPV